MEPSACASGLCRGEERRKEPIAVEIHEFDIAINPDGTVRIHVQGAKGPACEKYVGLFQEILGGEPQVERTSEYYEPPSETSVDLEQYT